MGKSLVIVESPSKARTISRFLGGNMDVLASMGHVRDLPESSLGVDVHHEFKPSYVLTPNGKKVIRDLRTAARDADDIYLATDPDREGEAIAWHLREVLKQKTKADFHRVTFHEITRSAIDHSFEHPDDLKEDLFLAQQARRVLDRLVGYQVSPLLWKNIRKGTSAGRVQSVALRLVVEREREIQGFEPVEYWNMNALFQTQDPEAELETKLSALDGSKPEIPDAATAERLAGEIEAAAFRVADVTSSPRTQYAPPPFITSTLQQSAGGSLRLSARDTMRVAQQLYEGIDLGPEGSVGLITYMRTDSFAVSKEAETQAREYIATRYGGDYIPAKPNRYRSRKSAQEAHEAIRPTDVNLTPERVAKHLNRRQLQLYGLIWKRFVASQMSPARQMDHVIEIEALGDHLTHSYTFRASARETIFPGYQAVYSSSGDDDRDDDETVSTRELPALTKGTPCDLLELEREQCFTSPPKRYTEASLIRELESNGVGRPSTYAATVNVIQDRNYVRRDRRSLVPTPLGFQVTDFLVSNMPNLFDVGFTAQMENDLDRIEDGDVDWTAMLEAFYSKLKSWVKGDLMTGAPTSDRAREFLDLFHDDIEWAPPTTRGRRTYDDRKFVASIRDQVEEGSKPLSDRQWSAIIKVAARYADQIPDLMERARDFGLEEKVKDLVAQTRQTEGEPEAGPTEEQRELLAAMADVSWAEPAKRGRRTYDDGKFYRSLKRQVDDGRQLSEAQTNSLKRLMVKYRGQVPNFDTLSETYDIELPKTAPQVQAEDVEPLLALIDGIDRWNPPRKVRRRTYDDREFATSLQEQFKQRKSLTSRQVNALKKMLQRYADQIDGYEAKVKPLGLLPPPEKPVEVSVPCPQCGAPLLKRKGRRGTYFYGCSAFPKCRFTANELPDAQDDG